MMKLARLSSQPLAVPELILVKETFSFLSLTLQDKDTHTHPQNASPKSDILNLFL